MKTIPNAVLFTAIAELLVSVSVLTAAPWAVVTDGDCARISTIDFGTAPPTAYGPFLQGQLGRTNSGGHLMGIAITPDGKKALVSHYGDRAVYSVDVSAPTNPVVLGCVSNLIFSEDITITPNGRFALVTDGSASAYMAIIDLSSFSTSINYVVTSGFANAVSVAPDNQTVLMSDYMGHKLIYGILGPTGLVSESVHTVRGFPSTNYNHPNNIAIAPDGQTVLMPNATSNDVNVFRIVSPGIVVTGETPTVANLAPVMGSQSIAFSPGGNKAYVLQNRNKTNTLTWLNINSPGNVSLGDAGVTNLLPKSSSQLLGVDTLAVSPDGAWILAGNPTVSSGRTNLMSLVNSSTFALTPLNVFMQTPVGVAFARTPGLAAHISLSPTDRAPVVGETLTYLIAVTNTGFQILNPVRLDLGYDTNFLTYVGGAPAADTAVGGVATWTNVGALVVGGQTVVTAQFTAACCTQPGSTTNSLVTTAYALGGFPLAPQTNSLPVAIAFSPLGADFDGDGKADPAVYDGCTATWNVKLSSAGYALFTFTGLLGGTSYVPLAADFDGDRLADPTVYEAALELWAVKLSSIGYLAPTVLTGFGGSDRQALAADFDGDRLADPATYNAATGTWKVKLSTANYTTVTVAEFLGFTDWTAVAADFDGDGKADPAIYQPSTGSWIVRLSRANYNLAVLDIGFLGDPGYVAMAADFDGDGFADPTVIDPFTGHWKVKLSSANYTLIDLPDFF